MAQRIEAMAARGTRIRSVMLDRLGPHLWQRRPAKESTIPKEAEIATLWRLCQPKP
ncbi:MAG: hypothetical protein MUF08_17370 [Burkholderiaceae bacterium]|nr:hypothetical protein [Burkholderiaceae bacterium]